MGKKTGHAEGGFTLLGVLIAVLILGVLATIAVPKFTAALAAANTTKIRADLSSIDTAAALYQIDKGSVAGSLEALEPYLENYSEIKPPTGQCNIKGVLTDVPAGGYTYGAKATGERSCARLGGYTVYDFGAASGSGGNP